jgi:serine O-acetyltransferase
MRLSEWLTRKSTQITHDLTINRKMYMTESSLLQSQTRAKVIDALIRLRALLLPGLHECGIAQDQSKPDQKIRQTAVILCDLIHEVLVHVNPAKKTAELIQTAETHTMNILEQLPDISRMLETDIQAAYEGDPAAASYEEVILSYPSLEAISIFRIAHLLYQLNIPIIPRVMTEYAHKNTGIDIHPGASIGSSFFIDHGTGVVIGETCTLGSHVKLYQGVTLGAKSFPLDKDGKPIKGIKRHPDIEDNVVIYAGATILGGNTRIGHDSVIGGNVWLMESVPPYSTVFNATPSPTIKTMTT